MINTFFNSGTLNTPQAFLTSLLLGILFGIALERGGFGSSRRLSGIFYFRDMTVLKVMFTALVVGMLGLSYARAFGWITLSNIHLLETLYVAQIAGGLLFGIGFVMGGWCPGTAAVGVASGKLDALLFLVGAVGGSMLYNETFPLVAPLISDTEGVQFAFTAFGLSEATFGFLFTLIAICCFWGAEWIEHASNGTPLQNIQSLKTLSLTLFLVAAGLFILPEQKQGQATSQEGTLLARIVEAEDHIEPEVLADRLMAGEKIVLVDLRSPEAFNQFHIRTAIHLQLKDLASALAAHKEAPLIVLYSNGMTHPAQARDSLERQGFTNVRHLTDGLEGFKQRCLKPVSLRTDVLTEEQVAKINAWRKFFIP
jgi:rhodanese-related sulfurtransferase/uncharacterized membrane protein YedE/YeeE